MFHSPICDLLGIRYPIIQGAMQGAGKSRLVAAVSEAGGLGVLPTFGGTEKELRELIEATRRLTAKPFAVNITPTGRAFTEARVAICIEMGVPIVTTGLGDPGPKAVEMMKIAGIKVIPVVPTVRHAVRMEAEGADAVVASGTEAGGHVGLVATMPLVPMVVDAVKIPVIAAGGIGDARGFLAAFALGACGVQIGTRFIATTENEGGDWYPRMIMETSEEGTVITRALTGKTVRAFATPEVKAYEEARLSGAPPEALKPFERAVRAGRHKDDGAPVQHQAVVGQICGMIRDVRPVGELIDEMLREAAALAGRMHTAAEA